MSSDHGRGGDLLDRAVATLAAEFVGVFAPETVERCLRDSYRQLAEQATVATDLPLRAQRFARERLLAARRSGSTSRDGVGVSFVCAHNSGRSQMAAGWLAHLSPELDVWSAGVSVDSVRSARDEIRERVEALIGSLRAVAS